MQDELCECGVACRVQYLAFLSLKKNGRGAGMYRGGFPAPPCSPGLWDVVLLDWSVCWCKLTMRNLEYPQNTEEVMLRCLQGDPG